MKLASEHQQINPEYICLGTDTSGPDDFTDAEVLEENMNMLSVEYSQRLLTPNDFTLLVYPLLIILLSYKKINFCYLILENFLFKNKRSNDSILLFHVFEY